MPDYKSHLSTGSIVFSIVLLLVVPYYTPSVTTAAEWYLFALAGSLFPDIDIKSKGQRYFYWFIFLLLILLATTKRFIALSIVSILAMLPLLGKHRGLFHKTWFIIGAPYLLWYIAACRYRMFADALFFDVLFFVAGALSHLWLDLGWRKMLRI
jgi:hypothetical protein